MSTWSSITPAAVPDGRNATHAQVCVCVCAHAEDVLYSSFCVSILQMASAKSPAGDDAGFPWQPVMVAGTVSESELALIHCHFTEMLKTHTHTQ